MLIAQTFNIRMADLLESKLGHLDSHLADWQDAPHHFSGFEMRLDFVLYRVRCSSLLFKWLVLLITPPLPKGF
jgi:hypothetical protein